MSNPYDFYADNGYQRIFNSHGLRALDKGVNVPDADLGIGAAELTAPLPLLVAYEPIIKQPVNTPVVSFDDTLIKTQTPGLQISTFPKHGYYGQPLGEV